MPHAFAARLKRPPPLLYALLDTRLCATERRVAFGTQLLEAGVDLLQIRAKGLAGAALLELAEALLPAARARGIPLLINDRVDIALACGADGVHLGRHDLPVPVARQLLGADALIGWSTHSLDELRRAPAQADYLALGAVFPTQTRADSAVLEAATLTEARGASTLPLLAIGGIRPENLDRLAGLGLAGIAVASGLTQGDAAGVAVPAYRVALGRWDSPGLASKP